MAKIIRFYNTLTRKKEIFKTIMAGEVGIYSCGPTVYDHAHMGHFRAYTFVDTLKRVLVFNGFKIKHIMNLTDVGHLTEYDVEEQMKKRGKGKGTVWEIAEFYTKEFFDAMEELNVLNPDLVCKASDHIKEQIKLIKRLEEKGYTYKIDDGVYFDVAKFPDYGKLGRLKLDDQEPGARVDTNLQKKNPYDFALWRFTKLEEKRAMEWDSPWGRGVPGWHIECSAMSMKYLGESFDIHTGGEDLISIHHTNEIAQSESATGKKFARYWIHNAHLMVEGERMSRSKGNFYTMRDIKKRGFNPLALRYLFLTAHYRSKMNFTWKALKAASAAYQKLVNLLKDWQNSKNRSLSAEKMAKLDSFRAKFYEKMSDDLGTPEALAMVWEVAKSDLPSQDKRDLILDFDQILGLDLRAKVGVKIGVPEEIKRLIEEREILRRKNQWQEADRIRKEVEERGWEIEDASTGTKLRKVNNEKG